MGGAAHADHSDPGRALRRRGRRVPDPRPQRVCRQLGGRVGDRNRRGTLRVPRRGLAAGVDARGVAAAILAQDGRGGGGDPADHRSVQLPAADCDPSRPRRRSRTAGRVVRPRRVVAVEPAARHAGSIGGSGRRSGHRSHGRRPSRRRSRIGRPPGPPGTRARANRSCRGDHDPRRSGRVGRSRRSLRAERSHAERVLDDPARGRGLDRTCRRPTPHPSTHSGCELRTGPRAGGRPEGHQLRDVHALRPAVRPAWRHESARERDRDVALLGRWYGDEAARGRRGGRHRRTGRPADAGDAATDAGCGRQPPLGAAGGRGARRRLGALLGVRRPAHLPHADRLHPFRRSGRQRGQRASGGHPRQERLRQADQPRPGAQYPHRPAADQPARQRRPARVHRGLRPTGRGGQIVLAGGRRRPGRGEQAAGERRLLVSQRVPRLGDIRRHQLAGALKPAGGTLGRQPGPLQPADLGQALHARPGVQAGRVADGSRRSIERPPVATGEGVLPLRPDLQPLSGWLSRPHLHLCVDARPVHVLGAPTARAREASQEAVVRGGGHDLESHAVEPHPAARSAGIRSGTARSTTRFR